MTSYPSVRPTGVGLRSVGSDVALLTGRCLRHELRSVEGLLIGIALPVMLMLLFVFVLGGAISTGASGLSYVDYVVPGVILLAAGYGAATTAITVAVDIGNGAFDRFWTLPIAGWAVPAGHVAASVVKNLATTAVVVAVAVAVGFRPQANPLVWGVAWGLIALFVLALTWLAVAVGMATRNPEVASAFSFVVLFVPYLSSAFVPVETMPAALRVIAEWQPWTPLANALRSLLLGGPVDQGALSAGLWWLGVLVLSVPVTVSLFRRRTGR